MSILWPRLPAATAEVLLERIRADRRRPEPTEGLSHSANLFAAVGGQRADGDLVASVRQRTLDTATAHGFPSDTTPQADLIRFDRALAPILLDTMGIVPAEAGNKHIWTNLALVIAPDITAWRFGFTNTERWIASDLTRHMFSRLWWQAFLLGTDDGLLDQLSESDLNQLLERTTLGGMRPVVQALARAVVDGPEDVSRRDLIRESALRLRRRMVFIDHMALSEAHLAAEAKAIVEDSTAALLNSDCG